MKKSILYWSGNFFLYVPPFIIVFLMYFDYRGSGYFLHITGIILLGILLIIYHKIFKKKIENKLLTNDIKRGYNPPIMQIIMGIDTLAILALIWLIINFFIESGATIKYFIIAVMVTVVIGRLLLALEGSRLREEEKSYVRENRHN